MIDFSKLQEYRENNRLEAKQAMGGLPKSIWETYSAFANTHGGIILLGVQEQPDKTFRSLPLPDPERLIREFWQIINDPKRASVNILSAADVFVQPVADNRIVVIHVPRAHRTCKPVYVDGDPRHTYRRNGEGDYRCTPEEYDAMVRDAAEQTRDMMLLPALTLKVLHPQSIRSYRQKMQQCRPGHPWEALPDADFLVQLGAAGIGADGCPHPTAAGLLMFGSYRAIRQQFPHYDLTYRSHALCICSDSGSWSGNLYDFYSTVREALLRDYFPESVRQALQEALTNCLVHADYYGSRGLVITQTNQAVTMSNPGGFRIGLEDAKSGGISDPRNSVLLHMLHLIDPDRCAGHGIPHMFRVWREQGWAAPILTEQTEPAGITLTLTFAPADDRTPAAKRPRQTAGSEKRVQESIIDYLTDHAAATTAAIAAHIGRSPTQTRRYLHKMMAEGLLTSQGNNRTRTYRLKY